MVTLQKEAAKEYKEPVCVILPYQKQGEYFVEDLGEVPSLPLYSFVKRTIDILAAVLALLLLTVPMALIAIGIKCSDRGTVFFTQERLGLNGKKFDIIKFRTMYMDAEVNGAQWSNGESDERIFPFGRFLRMTRMDELPQFWCILKGDLSLVGPRPERECFYDEFETYIHGFRERLKVMPGLTGLAQVNGGYDLKPEEKIIYDVEYIKTRSLWTDLKIMLKTVRVVLFQCGAK